MFIGDMFNEDSWNAGDNAWSSEHDQWAKESVGEGHEDSLNIGDEVLVDGPNQFQGKRGWITGFGRNKAFVIVEIDGKEYSMHSSDVVSLGNDEDEDYGTFGDDERDELDEDDEYDGVYNPKAIQVGRKMAEFYGFTDPDDIQFIIEIIDNHIQRAQSAGTPLNAQEIKKDVANAVRQAFRGLGSYPSMRKKFQYDDELEEELNEYKGAHDKVTFEVNSENAYNHVMDKYGHVIDWNGDYMTAPARYWPAIQELAFAAGGDVQEIELSEGAGFGAYYYEQLAQKVFDERPNFSTSGRADELVDYAYRFAVQDLGKNRARYEFNYDEDFLSDFVSAYGELQRRQQGVAEDLGTMAGAAALGGAAAYGIGQLAGKMINKFDKKYDGADRTTARKHKDSCACEKCRGSSDTRLKEGASVQDVFNAITYRIERQMPELFTDYGVEVVADAIKDVAEFHEGAEEIGSSDVGAMVRQVVRQLKQQELRKALDEVKKMSTQQKFEKHLAKHGYDVNAKQKYWDQKLKNIDAQIAAWDAEMAARKQNKGVAEGFSNDMSTQDMIAYLRKHHDKNLHPDYLNHLTGTNSKFVLKNIPLNSIKTDLSGLDRAKVEQYKKMDFSNAPPIVVGSDGNILDGYHRATVAKALGIPNIKAYIGVKGQQDVAEGKAVYYHVVDDNNKSIKAFMYSQDAIKFVNDRRKKDPTANKWKVVAKKNAVIGEQGVAEGSEILKAGLPVRVPHKGKMVPGKIVRYDSGKGGYSPAYVVDIGEYESKLVPVYDVKQGVAEGEYDDPRWEPREPDMSRRVDWDIEAERNKPEESEPAKTVTVRDNDGNVVLQFPSTGGFHGDVRYAASKGIDTDSGEYHMSWKRDANEDYGTGIEGGPKDTTSPIHGGRVAEGNYWKKLQQERFITEHKTALKLLNELQEVFKDK